MLTVIQPVIGDCFVASKCIRDGNGLVATTVVDGLWNIEVVLADDDIYWVATSMSEAEVNKFISQHDFKKAVVNYGSGFKKALVTENKHSAERIVFIVKDMDMYVVFSTWKSLVRIFVENDQYS